MGIKRNRNGAFSATQKKIQQIPFDSSWTTKFKYVFRGDCISTIIGREQ